MTGHQITPPVTPEELQQAAYHMRRGCGCQQCQAMRFILRRAANVVERENPHNDWLLNEIAKDIRTLAGSD